VDGHVGNSLQVLGKCLDVEGPAMDPAWRDAAHAHVRWQDAVIEVPASKVPCLRGCSCRGCRGQPFVAPASTPSFFWTSPVDSRDSPAQEQDENPSLGPE